MGIGGNGNVKLHFRSSLDQTGRVTTNAADSDFSTLLTLTLNQP